MWGKGRRILSRSRKLILVTLLCGMGMWVAACSQGPANTVSVNSYMDQVNQIVTRADSALASFDAKPKPTESDFDQLAAILRSTGANLRLLNVPPGYEVVHAATVSRYDYYGRGAEAYANGLRQQSQSMIDEAQRLFSLGDKATSEASRIQGR